MLVSPRRINEFNREVPAIHYEPSLSDEERINQLCEILFEGSLLGVTTKEASERLQAIRSEEIDFTFVDGNMKVNTSRRVGEILEERYPERFLN